MQSISRNSRKQIFSQYTIPKFPDVQMQIRSLKNIPSQSIQSQDKLIKLLISFKINIQSVLSQKNILLEKFTLLINKLNKVNEYISTVNEYQSIAQARLKNKKIIEHYDDIVKSQGYVYDKVMNLVEKYKNIHKNKYNSNNSEQNTNILIVLIIYKELLYHSRSLKYQAQNFRLGTLSNYNPQHTQPKFIRSAQQSQTIVLQYIKKIQYNLSLCMQSRTRFKNQLQKDRFLLQQQKYSNCLINLQKNYDPKIIQSVNFDMLNVLQQYDKKFKEFNQVLQSNQGSYKRYQGVNDSYCLMNKQIDQMDGVIKGWQENQIVIKGLSKENKQQSVEQLFQSHEQINRMISKNQSDKNILQNNLKIYNINSRIFSNYNTLTNMKDYSAQRNTYSLKLQQYHKKLSKQNQTMDKIGQIYQIQQKVYKIIRNTNIKNNKNNKKSYDYINQKPEIKKLINQMNSLSNVYRGTAVYQYRENVLQMVNRQVFKQESKNQNIYKSIRVGQSQQHEHINRLKIYNIFYEQLKSQKNNHKKCFIMKNSNKIEEYIKYNQNIVESLKGNTNPMVIYEYKKYTVGFKLCMQMILLIQQSNVVVSNNKDFNLPVQVIFTQLSKNFDSILQQNLQNIQKLIKSSEQIPQQIIQFLLNHFRDYSLIKMIFNKPSSQTSGWNKFLSTIDKIKGSNLGDNDQHKINVSMDDFVYRQYQQFPFNHLQMYKDTILKVSDYSPQIVECFQRQYWLRLISLFKSLYQDSSHQNIKKDIPIDKKEFFTIPKLLFLLKKYTEMTIKNIEDVLEKIVKDVQNKLHNFNQKQKFLLIVKLSILIEFLTKNQQVQINIKRSSIDKLNRNNQNLIQPVILIKLRKIVIVSLLTDQMIVQSDKQINKGNISQKQFLINFIALQEYLPSIRLSYIFQNQLQSTQQRKKLILTSQKHFQRLKRQNQPLQISILKNRSSITLKNIRNLFQFQLWMNIWKQLQIIGAKDSIIYANKSNQLKLSNSMIQYYSYLFVQLLSMRQIISVSHKPDYDLKQNQCVFIRKKKKKNYYLKAQVQNILKVEQNFKSIKIPSNQIIKKINSNNIDIIRKIKQFSLQANKIL